MISGHTVRRYQILLIFHSVSHDTRPTPTVSKASHMLGLKLELPADDLTDLSRGIDGQSHTRPVSLPFSLCVFLEGVT